MPVLLTFADASNKSIGKPTGNPSGFFVVLRYIPDGGLICHSVENVGRSGQVRFLGGVLVRVWRYGREARQDFHKVPYTGSNPVTAITVL